MCTLLRSSQVTWVTSRWQQHSKTQPNCKVNGWINTGEERQTYNSFNGLFFPLIIYLFILCISSYGYFTLWKIKNLTHSWRKCSLFSVCLRGIKAHRKCYLTIDEPKHYHEANEDCIAQGGTLATPRDMTENNELRDYAKRSAPGSKDFWIGVADIVKEGQYVDVNSLPVSYFNWDRSKKQPTGTKRESCVALSVVAQGRWHDEVCRSLKKYICEYIIP